MLSRLALMVQAAVLDGEFLDLLPPLDDGGVPAEVDVGGGDVAQALVVTATSGSSTSLMRGSLSMRLAVRV